LCSAPFVDVGSLQKSEPFEPEKSKPSLKHCAEFALTRKPQRVGLARIPYFRHVYYRVANLRDAASLFTDTKLKE
jgi:hypothetical protein